ncbi:MAG: hypothetical protein IJW02_02380 [Clostridia bacterium]|nr:hypothetical protein [Clostridia bacterium]
MERLEALEKRLRKHILVRRLITLAVFIALLAIGIVFGSLREATKEVVVHGEGIFSYETVSYNNDYAVGIVIGILGATMTGCILLSDLILSRFATTEANGHYLTVSKGMIKCEVYVDGELAGTIGVSSFTNVVDTRLPDGTKAAVAFSKGALTIAHVSFSDNNPSVDL